VSELDVPDPVPTVPDRPIPVVPVVPVEPVAPVPAAAPLPAVPPAPAPPPLPAANAMDELKARTEANPIVASFMIASLVGWTMDQPATVSAVPS